MTILNANGNTIFSASNQAVSIAGWKVDSNSLYSGNDFASAAIWLCRGTSGAYTIDGHSGTGRVFKAGSSFGVNTNGELYCTSAHLTGAINATSGTFSNCTIDNTCTINGTLTAPNICNNVSTYGGNTTNGSILFGGTNSSNCYYILRVSKDAEPPVRADVTVTNTNGRMDASIVTTNNIGGIFKQAGIIITGNNTDIYGETNYLYGTWYCNGSLINSSDQNVKNSIEDLSDAYSVFFDAIKPRRYKYNAGTSGRFHTGFIAQEIDAARETAGIPRSDLAAICISDEGAESEAWGIRYEEIIAINTMEIQKLKARVAALEQS
jgi:hypothetical protein